MKKVVVLLSVLLLIIIASWSIYNSIEVRKNQSAEIRKEYAGKQAFQQDDLSDLPLLRFESKGPGSDYFVILFPGDGGWRDFIDYLSNYMAGSGINVVGFNTIPYFSDTRKPSEIASDLQRVMANFSEAWEKKKVVLAGYSFGAEILPFVYNQLDSSFKSRVICMTLIAPSNLADFKVSPVYYYNPSKSIEVMPELQKIRSLPTLVFCDKQKNSLCKYISNDSIDVVQLEYGHLFIGKFKVVSATITSRLIKELEGK